MRAARRARPPQRRRQVKPRVGPSLHRSPRAIRPQARSQEPCPKGAERRARVPVPESLARPKNPASARRQRATFRFESRSLQARGGAAPTMKRTTSGFSKRLPRPKASAPRPTVPPEWRRLPTRSPRRARRMRPGRPVPEAGFQAALSAPRPATRGAHRSRSPSRRPPRQESARVRRAPPPRAHRCRRPSPAALRAARQAHRPTSRSREALPSPNARPEQQPAVRSVRRCLRGFPAPRPTGRQDHRHPARVRTARSRRATQAPAMPLPLQRSALSRPKARAVRRLGRLGRPWELGTARSSMRHPSRAKPRAPGLQTASVGKAGPPPGAAPARQRPE